MNMKVLIDSLSLSLTHARVHMHSYSHPHAHRIMDTHLQTPSLLSEDIVIGQGISGVIYTHVISLSTHNFMWIRCLVHGKARR